MKNSCFVLPQEVDDMTRVGEAVTKIVVFALKGASSGDNDDDWLNPTEVALYIHLSSCLEKSTLSFYVTTQTNMFPF